MPIDVPELLDQVQAGRRGILVGLVVAALLAVGTFIGPILGALATSVLTAGSSFTAGAPLATGLSETAVTAGVGLGSIVFSAPICVFLLGLSVVWHLRVRRELVGVGVASPAVGIAAPARLVAVPVLLGLVVLVALVPVPILMPTPDAGDIVASAVGGMAWALPVLGPVLGLLLGWRLGFDRAATRRWRAGELTLDEVPDDVAAFPLIARRPRALVRAELLRRAGELDAADALLRRYLERVGVGPHQALLTWARVHRDAGRPTDAAVAAAAAARLVPFDVTSLRVLSEIAHDLGERRASEALSEGAEALRGGLLGLVVDDRALRDAALQRVQA